MAKDIVPELLEKIVKDFNNRYKNNKDIATLLNKLNKRGVTYEEAHKYAIAIGDILSRVFKVNLSSKILPDGRMYFNIGERIVGSTLTNNYNLVSDYTTEIQNILNEEAGLGIKAKVPEINQDRINGIVNRLDSELNFDDIKWILDEPVVNFTQSVVDDFVEVNSGFHENLGMKPKIIRTTTGDCCDWCANLAGTYDYNEVKSGNSDVFRRHEYCRCTIEYIPGDGTIQNVKDKTWR